MSKRRRTRSWPPRGSCHIPSVATSDLRDPAPGSESVHISKRNLTRKGWPMPQCDLQNDSDEKTIASKATSSRDVNLTIVICG